MTKVMVVRHVPFEDLGILGPLVAEQGWQVNYHDVWQPASDLIAQSSDAGLVVVLGGPIGVADRDQYPFLDDEISLVRQRLDAGLPLLGVCLGAQLMAAALGGGVRAGTPEIGFAPVQLTDAGASSPLAGLSGAPVLHWHGDRIWLPSTAEVQDAHGAAIGATTGVVTGAQVLASTDATAVQGFAAGDHGLGLQFHLEVDPARIESWLVGHAHELASAEVEAKQLREQAHEVGPMVAEAGRRVLADWLRIHAGAITALP